MKSRPVPIAHNKSATFRGMGAARFVQAGQQAGLPLNDDFNGERQEGVGWYQVTHRDGERCSTAKAFLRPAVQRGLEIPKKA